MLVELDDEVLDKIMAKRMLDDYYNCKEYAKDSAYVEDADYYYDVERALKTALKYYMLVSDYEEVFGEGSYSED